MRLVDLERIEHRADVVARAVLRILARPSPARRRADSRARCRRCSGSAGRNSAVAAPRSGTSPANSCTNTIGMPDADLLVIELHSVVGRRDAACVVSVRRKLRAQFVLMPALSTTSFHIGTSRAMRAASACGPSGLHLEARLQHLVAHLRLAHDRQHLLGEAVDDRLRRAGRREQHLRGVDHRVGDARLRHGGHARQLWPRSRRRSARSRCSAPPWTGPIMPATATDAKSTVPAAAACAAGAAP